MNVLTSTYMIYMFVCVNMYVYLYTHILLFFLSVFVH